MRRQPRQHFEKHLAFIRQLPCAICGNNVETEAAHVRMGDNSVAKPTSGFGTKPHDYYTVPLCGRHHREQHNHGDEADWWNAQGRDPVKLALALYVVSGDFERGEQIAQAR